MTKITAAFFHNDPVDCARELIGCCLGWGGCSGRIVETEAYRAVGDKACHTFMRPSARGFVAAQPAGTAYVYLSYGVHWLFNILIKGPQGDGFVLLRALEPLEGLDVMRQRRGNCADRLLMAGPGRLTQALGISDEAHGSRFLENGMGSITAGAGASIVSGPRIGISHAVDLPWRFGDPASKCLTKRFRGV